MTKLKVSKARAPRPRAKKLKAVQPRAKADTYGHGFDLNDFSKTLPGQLLAWFHEMFKYAAESRAAQRIVGKLLGPDGPFQDLDYLENVFGAKFFLSLTEANPEAALRCLMATIGGRSREELLALTTGRREAVWALERIAVWRPLFVDAARLLLQLGEAENETWGNNASGVFAGLFSAGTGAVAPTEAPPEERFPVLKEAIESSSKERRALALRACGSALEATFFSRTVGAEHQGLHRQPKLWTPSTWPEFLDSYRRVWSLLRERLDALPDDQRADGLTILLDHTRGLAKYPPLLDMLTETQEDLARKPYADRRRIFQTVQSLLHYDGKEMQAGDRDRWQQLKRGLLGDDFHSRMERYVGMDLLEDKFDEDGNQVDTIAPEIENLAAQAVRKPGILQQELPWLVTNAAENGFWFGYALGTKDTDLSLLETLRNAQRNAEDGSSAFFFGGYLRALSERDRDRWENILDEFSHDEILRRHVVELTWRNGLSDRAGLRVLGLAEEGYVKGPDFRIFAFGSVLVGLSEEVFRKWIVGVSP